jgi:uncharacterized membrane protein
MKSSAVIIGINLIILFIAIIYLGNVESFPDGVIIYLTIFAFALSNLAVGASFYFRGNKADARAFVLSGLLILIVGTSSCVTIKRKPKKSAPKTNTEKVDTLNTKP